MPLRFRPPLPPVSRRSAAKPQARLQTGHLPGHLPGICRASAGDGGILQSTLQAFGNLARRQQETHSDSEAVIVKAQYYGSRHFNNPRRLKRFINGFRLQTYLTEAIQPSGGGIDRLARFLVLAEKWPALVEHLLQAELGADFWKAEEEGMSTSSIAVEIRNLPDEERKKLMELLEGPDAEDPFEAEGLKNLAEWYGFCYYRGIATNGP